MSFPFLTRRSNFPLITYTDDFGKLKKASLSEKSLALFLRQSFIVQVDSALVTIFRKLLIKVDSQVGEEQMNQ